MNATKEEVFYVYGFTRPSALSDELLGGLLQDTGVPMTAAVSSTFSTEDGRYRSTPFLWYYQDIAVVLSRVGKEEFCGPAAESNLQDLAWIGPRACWHQVVIEQVVRSGPVLPARFATLFSSLQNLASFLRAHCEVIGRFLDRVTGQDEWAVKGYFDRGRLSEDLSNPASTDRQRQSSVSPGLAYLQERRLKVRAEQKLDDRRVEACGSVERELIAVASEVRHLRVVSWDQGKTTFGKVVNWAFLVPRTAVTEFRTRLEQANIKQAPLGLTFDLSGPWPPYSFCPSLEPTS